jgi:hypothetical protein
MRRRTAELVSPSRRLCLASASIVLAFLLSTNSASAGIEIHGTADELHLTVENATITEILNALSARFNVAFKDRSHSPRVLNGVYSGTLREALARVLDGNDYIFQVSDRGLDVLILGASTAAQARPQPGYVAAAAAPPVQAAPLPPAQSAAKPSSAATSLASSPPPAQPNHNQLASTPSVPPLSSFAVVLPPP